MSGVLFGATSQVNLHSLVASTLELGASTIPTGSTVTPTRTLSLAERNDAYLQNGILSASRSGLLVPMARSWPDCANSWTRSGRHEWQHRPRPNAQERNWLRCASGPRLRGFRRF